MLKYHEYYNRPVFRKNVKITITSNEAFFSYFGTSFSVEFGDENAKVIGEFIETLKTGLNYQDFNLNYPKFKLQTDELFGTFDRYGFISESQMPASEKGLTGKQLWKIIDKYTTDFLQTTYLPFGQQLLTSQTSKAAIVCYALQYYHFVKAGPSIIASAYANADREPVRKILEHFLVSELGHDMLLLKALKGAGVDLKKVRNSLPLPETFALISAFHVMASQEPLSFYSTVFLVEEERPAFNEALITSCKAVGLNKNFYSPILSHSHINEEEDHGAISLELLQNFSIISNESRIVALKQVHSVLESMVALEAAILREADLCLKSIT